MEIVLSKVLCNLKSLINQNIIYIICLIYLCESQEIVDDLKKLDKLFVHDPDFDRSAIEIIKSRGFKSETHYVTTEDNYILALYRIINPYLKKNKKKRKTILLQHGLNVCCDTFIVNTEGMIGKDGVYRENGLATLSCDGLNPNRVGVNLGFVLSACGYDVWLGNLRGNRYSENHTYLNPKKDEDFWKFSSDEIAQYDIPAIVHHIRNITNKKYIAYVGHSLGTQVMFALLADDPSFERFVKPIIMLAPVAYLGHLKGLARIVASLFEPIFRHLHGGLLERGNKYIPFISRYFCGTIGKYACALGIQSYTGFDFKNFNISRTPVLFNHYLDGTSIDSLAHLTQSFKSKRFRKRDFGKKRNLNIYGQENPPDYDLSKIKSRNIALFWGLNDFLSNLIDVQILRNELTVPLIDDYVIPDPEWNHFDYFLKSAGFYVNSRILKIMNRY